ncbi:MAG TPA: hypothetical protein VNJ09_09440 [Chthonomonadales bacterium]|nr:hypothetical protein [Chthonomonadales bacterium]
MRFPKERIRFSTSVDGRTTPGGFLVLDLKGLDIEGVDTFVLEMSDIEQARARGDQQADALKRAREILGG